MVFDWINIIHPTNQMGYNTPSIQDEIRETEQRLKRLEEELRHDQEKNRRMQEDIEYANAKYYPNQKLDEAIARDRALAKARGDDNKWGFTAPSSQRPWEIARDLERAERARVKARYPW